MTLSKLQLFIMKVKFSIATKSIEQCQHEAFYNPDKWCRHLHKTTLLPSTVAQSFFFFNCVFTKVELGERSQWLVMSLACSSKIHTKGSHFSKLTNFYPTTESLSLVAHVNFSQVWRGTWNKSYNYKWQLIIIV